MGRHHRHLNQLTLRVCFHIRLCVLPFRFRQLSFDGRRCAKSFLEEGTCISSTVCTFRTDLLLASMARLVSMLGMGFVGRYISARWAGFHTCEPIQTDTAGSIGHRAVSRIGGSIVSAMIVVNAGSSKIDHFAKGGEKSCWLTRSPF